MKYNQKKTFFNNERERGFIPYERTQFDTQSVKKNFRRKITDSRTGFTLVELIVSMSLFIVVVFITTSAFLTLADLSKKASATRIAIDNLSVAVEDMARKLRTGYYYRCAGEDAYADLAIPPVPRDCSSSTSLDNSSISFQWSETSALAAYWLVVDPGSGRGRIMFGDASGVGGLSWSDYLTSPEINITNLKFYVIGAEGVGLEQPRVNIVVQGIAGMDVKTQSNFTIYTSVTQRSPK
ncbi:MAG: hypothetical protein Q7S11_00325 [bacterium]|nr:hypothetical protein [bacterium]